MKEPEREGFPKFVTNTIGLNGLKSVTEETVLSAIRVASTKKQHSSVGSVTYGFIFKLELIVLAGTNFISSRFC